MKRLHIPLQPAYAVTSQQARLKGLELGKRRQAKANLQNRLNLIRRQTADYERSLATEMGQIGSVQEIAAFHSERNRLLEMAELCCTEIKEHDEAIKQLRDEYQNLQSKQKALESLIEKKETEHRRVTQKHTQQELDDLTLQAKTRRDRIEIQKETVR